MRTETFTESHPVELTEDERMLRGRQAARQAVAVRAQKERQKTEAEAWKLRKKALEQEELDMLGALYATSEAAEKGVELRQVPCREVLSGGLVLTIRLDTEEQVGSRSATHDEMRDAPDAMIPGGGSRRTVN